MTKLHKTRISMLTTALLSKVYKQSSGRLRSKNGWCCLGVACEVYRVATGKGEWAEPSEIKPFETPGYVFNITHKGKKKEQATTFLPETVADWFGFSEVDTRVALDGGCIDPALLSEKSLTLRASDLNDGTITRKRTFKQIAKMFEKKYLSE